MSDKSKIIRDKLMQRDFTFYFFVVDSRNIPNGAMFYSYTMAKEIQNLGYNVKMVYQYEGEDRSIPERSFVGVGEWLGKDYSEGLEHVNMNKIEIKFTSLDYIMIPMGTPSLTLALREYKVPSTVIMLCNNPILPLSTYDVGATYSMYGFDEVWCISENCYDLIKPLVGGNTNVRVVTSKSILCGDDKTLSDKPLSVGVYVTDEHKMKELYNAFISLYPKYNFITFTPTRMFSYEDYNKCLNNTPILIWIDDESVNGQTLREFSERTNVIIAKRNGYINETINGFSDRLMVWTDSIYEIAMKLGSVIDSFLNSTEIEIEEVVKTSIQEMSNNDRERNSVKGIVNSIIDTKILHYENKVI